MNCFLSIVSLAVCLQRGEITLVTAGEVTDTDQYETHFLSKASVVSCYEATHYTLHGSLGQK